MGGTMGAGRECGLWICTEEEGVVKAGATFAFGGFGGVLSSFA